MTITCGCCQGTEQLTPRATANRPGLRALSYRAGTHATFLETMMARLSSIYLDLPRDEFDEHGQQKTDRAYPLRNLRTRASDDPAIALLDAWAVLGDVLTFYQERIANEGYLITAIERRSILELTRLIGYGLRPGVSASVFLAYTIDDKSTEPVIIPAGAKSQSVPGPGELPQTFETSEPLEARAAWNNLRPRQRRAQTKTAIDNSAHVYLKGITTNLKANDPLLIDFGGKPIFYRITEALPDPDTDRTLVKFEDWHVVQTVGNLRRTLENAIRDLRDTTSLSTSTAKSKFVARLLKFSDELEDRIAAGTNEDEIAALHDEALSNLENELSVAESDAKFKNVKAWLAPAVEKMRAGAISIEENELPALAASTGVTSKTGVNPIVNVISMLAKSGSVPPRSTNFLTRTPQAIFTANSDIGSQVITTLQPALRVSFATAFSGAKATRDSGIHVYAMRVKTGPFGQTAPKKVLSVQQGTGRILRVGEWPIIEIGGASVEEARVLFLDGSYDKILPKSWVVIDTTAVRSFPEDGAKPVQVRPAHPPQLITQVVSVQADPARAEYGISGKTTRLELQDDWLVTKPFKPEPPPIPVVAAGADDSFEQGIYDRDFAVLRGTIVYAQSEELPLAEASIEDDICGGSTNWIELDGWYADLKSGRWAIVSGERADIKVPDPNRSNTVASVPGIKASELVMLAEVIQDLSTEDAEPSTKITGQKSKVRLPAEKPHTFVRFAKPLSYCYRRDSATIYGNVVKATHGETRKEVLGSGDASQALQSFTLKQPPLTFVAAPNPQGVESTLKLYVNDVQWHETNSLAGSIPADRKFVTRANDDAQTTIIFGNGEHGARPPTGRENLRAEYRNGIGKAGNVNAEQISLLMTRPYGVKEVINPLRASGGADKESRDQARENAPLAVTALDRLVSTQDYADFARTFAGIGKAAAARLADGQSELVHVTIAGADDIPIEPTSDLYRNLVAALRQFGDPFQP
ncbi:MAG TPA: putative baseplate assembly protein, partial [Pyrinomonadaceae bacterium]|nr:putative baseplate assembly protein [Pyrinomonadaceae bacterium]